MPFPKEVILDAWRRAGGRCECCRTTCGHGSHRCNKVLIWDAHGDDDASGGWEAHHKTAVASGGIDSPSNCEILCIDCHKNTRSYGR